MKPGSVYRLDSVAIGVHFWAVLSLPNHDEEVAASIITTLYGNGREDHSCLLGPDDHPGLDHQSWVKYDNTKMMGVSYLSRYGGEHPPLTEDATVRLLEGAANTDNLRLSVERLLIDQGLI